MTKVSAISSEPLDTLRSSTTVFVATDHAIGVDVVRALGNQNAPDDLAGASKFSIRKRPIARFGPSDCSSLSASVERPSMLGLTAELNPNIRR